MEEAVLEATLVERPRAESEAAGPVHHVLRVGACVLVARRQHAAALAVLLLARKLPYVHVAVRVAELALAVHGVVLEPPCI